MNTSRKVCGPPMSKTKTRCSSRISTISTPYGVRNCRATPDGLQRVCGSSSLLLRSAKSALAHGWKGMSLICSGFGITGPGSHTPFSVGVAPPSST